MTNHPIQPLAADDNGVTRFKRNAIVCHLLDHGGIDLNALAGMDFSDDDRRQFSQLIGYSLSGYGELPYVDDYTYNTAAMMFEDGLSEKDARIAHLEGELAELRTNLRSALQEAVAHLFNIHPDDLGGKSGE